MDLLKKTLLFSAFAGILSTSCSSSFRTVQKNEEKKIFNLKYGMEKRNVMDVFLPQYLEEKTPFVVIVHGGGWVFGQKEHMWNVRNFLFKNNIPSASINYRLVDGKTTYKEQLEDIGRAVKFVRENANSWNLKNHDIILLGESAGAHLALLYGYRHTDEIKKIISMSGPTDFYSENFMKSRYFKRSHKVFQMVVGGKYSQEEDIEKFRQASPIAVVSNVPTLIFQGDKDFLVDKSQGKVLDSVLTEKGFVHKFVEMKGSGHVPRIFDKKMRDNTEFPEILEFIKQ